MHPYSPLLPFPNLTRLPFSYNNIRLTAPLSSLLLSPRPKPPQHRLARICPPPPEPIAWLCISSHPISSLLSLRTTPAPYQQLQLSNCSVSPPLSFRVNPLHHPQKPFKSSNTHCSALRLHLIIIGSSPLRCASRSSVGGTPESLALLDMTLLDEPSGHLWRLLHEPRPLLTLPNPAFRILLQP